MPNIVIQIVTGIFVPFVKSRMISLCSTIMNIVPVQKSTPDIPAACWMNPQKR